MDVSATAPAVRSLPELLPLLRRVVDFTAVLDALLSGDSGTIDGTWGSSCALVAATLASQTPGVLLVVLPRISDVDDFAADVASYLPEPPLVFPAWEGLPKERAVSDHVFGGRLRVLQQLESAHGEQSARATDGQVNPRVVITSIPALLQPIPSREARARGTRRLTVGESLDFEELLRWFSTQGFERTPSIEGPGEFAVHGGIVDVFPPDAVDPLRIEFFGDEVDSIRRFDVETQRKVEDLRSVELTVVVDQKLPDPASKPAVGKTSAAGPGSAASQGPPARHRNAKTSVEPRAKASGDSAANGDGAAESNAAHFVDALPGQSWVLLSELPELVEEGRHYLQRLDNPRGLFSVEATLARCTQRPSVTTSSLSAGGTTETTCHLRIESIERFTGPRTEVLKELAGFVGRDESVLIACHNEGEQARLGELLREHAPELLPRTSLCLGTVTRGFRLVAERILILSDHELFNRVEIRRGVTRRKRLETRAIDSFLDLKEGDLVVHLAHGIGRYRGMQVIEKEGGREEGGREEHLIVEFREGVKIYVPVTLIHLVQKYVGATKALPQLSKVGGTAWANSKKRVAEAVSDMASDMLRLQFERQTKPGHACPPDSHLQQEFEAAFPYDETTDQLSAIADCKRDLEQPRPMDRLICGDVGFGKTEVAMRSVFKMVDAGKQVAVLVPTTVLADQHFRTFCERMAEYPISVEVLSRFRSPAETREVLKRMAAGTVDVVIGTHRIVQADVKFFDLGLLVIDEEQRFGVEAKEMLKRLRLSVDVLTLSATPIPRTLHLSLLGIRDISNLTTPPQDRMAIETRIVRWDGELIRQAIVRELNRGGQIYFVHNRVYDIQTIADRINSIVPEARIAIAHGQMNEHELEKNMLDFVHRRADVLVATTIIESGLDIPNANTMFIHEANNYGLADLHQLRGRVGRYKHRAYCYLIVESHRLSSTSARRLKAIEEFSELGAGFKIAMRDLEIRGAGNILGTEQSGHISTVGYELYCQLLENAVRREKKMPERKPVHVDVNLPLTAFLPNSYVPPGRTKIDLYRKLGAAATLDELAEAAAEMRDRFGPPPPEAEEVVRIKELQLLAWRWSISAIHLEEGRFAVLTYGEAALMRRLRDLLGSDLRIVDGTKTYLLLPQRDMPAAEVLSLLKSALDR